MINNFPAKIFLLLIGALSLASCGTSSGGGGAVPVTAIPSVSVNYDTVEYRNNYGLDQIHAITAYDQGATGAGITVGVIDTGIDINNTQIMANIHPDSINIVSGLKSDLNDVDVYVAGHGGGHGTAVSGVIAAIRDPSNSSNVNNTQGVAFDAKIMAINAAVAGSCGSTGGCTFSDFAIARALDYVRVRGVKIVNISLGGDSVNSLALVDAYKRAVNAGMVIVLAAGNRKDTDTNLTMAQPENSAAVAWQSWANGQIIVAGAVDETASITDFSHRAGTVAKDVFLVAGGDSILSLGLDENGDEAYYLWSGTSFSVPHISGAVALLMDAFPNLTGKQVADLLFNTATDLGAVGSDVIYGSGLINLEEAFRPQGTTSIAVRSALGETALVDLKASVLLAGNAFGAFSTFSNILGNSMMLDGYQRSYRVDLGQKIFAQRDGINLEPFMESQNGSRTSGLQINQDFSVQFYWQDDQRFSVVDAQYFSNQDRRDNRSHNVRMKLNFSVTPHHKITFSQGFSIKATMEDYDQNAFLTIGKEDFSALIGGRNNQTMIFGQTMGKAVKLDLVLGHGAEEWPLYNLTADSYIVMAKLDYGLESLGNVHFDLGIISERGSVLGSLSKGAIALGKGATTTFMDVGYDMDASQNIQIFSKVSYGMTAVSAADLSLVEKIGNLRSGSFSIGINRTSLFQIRDRLSLEVSQPLRVMGGYADISYAQGRNDTTESLFFAHQRAGLAPNGHELDFELAYRMGDFFGAQMDINLLHQISPNHNKENPDNTSILLRLGSIF